MRVPWTARRSNQSILKEISLGVHWKDWCWSWNLSTLASWCEELTHLKRPWCWERLKVGEEEDNRGWDGWMASPTQWKWVWINSGSWWWTGRPGMLRSMGSQRVGHDWATELNWTCFKIIHSTTILKIYTLNAKHRGERSVKFLQVSYSLYVKTNYTCVCVYVLYNAHINYAKHISNATRYLPWWLRQ